MHVPAYGLTNYWKKTHRHLMSASAEIWVFESYLCPWTYLISIPFMLGVSKRGLYEFAAKCDIVDGYMQQDTNIPQSSPEQPDKKILASDTSKEGWRSVLSTVLILALAPLIAWLMITFVFQSYEVDGPSMESTLQDKDRLIVLKTGKTAAKISNDEYIPKRHEIIIFVKHGLAELGTAQDKQLIKRVIALPGERVVVKDGKITVYNDEHPEGFDPDKDQDYAKSIAFTNGNVDIVVPEGQVFVAGDNRGNSLDSRSFGPVNHEDIIGKLVFRLFPINKAEGF